MRTYGRLKDDAGNYQWVKIETQPNGDNSEVWLTTLVQTLKLSRQESPFWANYGIPAQQSVMTQVYPDFFVAETQSQFSQHFVSLSVTKLPEPTPTYRIVATTPRGSLINRNIAI